MDHFETPYDVEDEFIECKACAKSIRGETLYKIHLTTPGHIKKEESFVTGGCAVRQRSTLDFKDILDYLDYLRLNEPIIGLQYLEEVASNDPHSGPMYFCKLCNLTVNIAEMVHHVIGRKHRQKYVILQRPDLVTWDKQSLSNQGGKIMRAKAEIIERQDGRGKPLPLANRGSKAPLLKQKQHRDKTFLPSRLTGHKDYENKYAPQGGHFPEFPETLPFHQEEPYMDRVGMVHQWEDKHSGYHMDEEWRRADCRGYGGGHMDPYNDIKYIEDPQRSTTYEPGGDAWHPEEKMPTPQGLEEQYYTEKAVSYRRPLPERDPLKEFYTEEVRRQQVRSEYQNRQQIYKEDQRQWSVVREPARHETKNIASMQGFSEQEAKRHYIAPIDNDQSHDLFNVIKDYQHKLREPIEEPGPSKNVPPSSERTLDITNSIAGVPEPFRRFLLGTTNNELLGTKRRKSRFSDAAADDVEMTKEMNDVGPPNPKFARHPREMSVPLGPESQATHYDEFYTESQTRHPSEDYHGGGSQNVYDMLEGIEIENAEDADFLKSKLCSLLKEFKAKKSEKPMNHGGTVLNNNYNRLKPDPQPSSGLQYDRPLGEDFDLRRPRDLSFKGGPRRQGWEQQGYSPNERLQDHHHSVPGEPEHTYRSRYEDETVNYTERFEEPRRPLDHQPAAQRYFDSNSPSPYHHMEGRRMPRAPQYTNSLDKITATLLELVARK